MQAASTRITELERPVLKHMLEGLLHTPGVTVYGPQSAEGRVGTVAFRVEGQTPAQTAESLSARGVDVGAGHFYAVQPLKDLGVYPEGIVRASIAHYTTGDDVERMLAGLR